MSSPRGFGGFEPPTTSPERRALFDIKRDFGGRLTNIEDATPGEPNGFEDRADCVLSFNNATRTLTLTGDYTFFARGKKFSKKIDSFQISDTEGDHYVYYGEDGKLAELTTFNPSIIGQDCFVSYIYWDTVNNEAVPWALCEQHGSSMSAVTHSYLHNTRGSAYDEGLLPAAVTVDGSGNIANSARFTTTSGVIWDEDIRHTILAHTSVDIVPYLYRSGASGLWRMDNDNEYIARKGATRAVWNEFTGGAWQLTELANNDYGLSHVFAIPGTNETSGAVIIIAGQADYPTVVAARDGALTEINNLVLDGLPTPEFVPVATFIFQTANTFTNPVAARIVSTDTGDEYIDWRGSTLAGGGGSGPDLVLSNATPQPTDPTTPAPGTSPETSRADHVHLTGIVRSNTAPLATSETTASAGVSDEVSRRDHVHVSTNPAQIVLVTTPDRVYAASAAAGTITITLAATVGGVAVAGATGVFGSITAVSGGSSGYAVAFPQALASHTDTSNVNFASGVIGNGFFITTLDSSRRFKLYRNQTATINIDIQGFLFT